MPNVTAATQSDAQAFYDLCQWVFECWIVHSHLFHHLPERLREERNLPFTDLAETACGRCLVGLNEMSRQYVLLQIAKLHDPARLGGNENLSIEYFVKQEAWSGEEASIIEGIYVELEKLYKQIEIVRHKILAHNDRSVYAKDLSLGSFPEGQDEDYFRALAKLCAMIWNKFHKGRGPYGNRVFDFTKSGMPEDPLCPSNDARALRELIVGAFPEHPDEFAPA